MPYSIEIRAIQVLSRHKGEIDILIYFLMRNYFGRSSTDFCFELKLVQAMTMIDHRNKKRKLRRDEVRSEPKQNS